jgi:hypothetical protein
MQDTIRQTFDTLRGSHLVVENTHGPITVSGWDRSQIEVAATPRQDWVKIEISQYENKVVARTKTEHGAGKWMNWFNDSRTPHVEYDVNVPHSCDIEVKNVEGSILIRHCSGTVRVHNVDGKVTLDHVQGDIRVDTVNGPLSADHLQGDAQLKTVNGKLTLKESVLSSFSAQTVNGKIKAAAAWDADAQISLHTVNGDCDLTVPADFRARASAHGVNVSVTCPQAETVQRQFSGWHGTIGPKDDQQGEPHAEIAFHTVNGHLRIDDGGAPIGTATQFAKKASEDEPLTSTETKPEPAQVKVPPIPPQEAQLEPEQRKTQLQVLQMVERGEITVQEAIEILEA